MALQAVENNAKHIHINEMKNPIVMMTTNNRQHQKQVRVQRHHSTSQQLCNASTAIAVSSVNGVVSVIFEGGSAPPART